MTPEMVAMKDFMDGMDAGSNPYPAGTEHNERWQVVMNDLMADELKREMMEYAA